VILLYLSQLILNPKSKRVWHDLGNIHDMHRTILSGFPVKKNENLKARAEFAVLFRVEKKPGTSYMRVLIQSKVCPDWLNLPDQYLLKHPNISNPEIKNLGSILSSIKQGSKFHFNLLANPTKKIKTAGKNKAISSEFSKNGKRIPLLHIKDQLEWLQRKSQKLGFEIVKNSVNNESEMEQILLNNQNIISGYKPKLTHSDQEKLKSSKNHKLTFAGVHFKGILEVSDEDLFLKCIETGIGSAKAYGFGMLSILPKY